MAPVYPPESDQHIEEITPAESAEVDALWTQWEHEADAMQLAHLDHGHPGESFEAFQARWSEHQELEARVQARDPATAQMLATPFPAETAQGAGQAGKGVAENRPTVHVPRALFEGKATQVIRANLRREGFEEAIIAHVMVCVAGVPKGEAGRSLRLGHDLEINTRDESTFRKHTNRLLAKADGYNIVLI